MLRSAFFWDVMQRRLVVCYRRFGTTSRCQLQRSSSPRSLKIRTIGCPQTSVQNCHSTLRNIPEERRCYLNSGGSLKSFLDACFQVVALCTCVFIFHVKTVSMSFPWGSGHLQKLTFPQPFKELAAFFGSRRLVTLYTIIHNLFVTRYIQCNLSNPISLTHFNIIRKPMFSK
jgi:hypothetical protein